MTQTKKTLLIIAIIVVIVILVPILYLKGTYNALVNMDVKLAHQIRAEDGLYRCHGSTLKGRGRR